MIKKIAFVLLAGLVIIQFFRPERNISTAATPNDIGNKYAVPSNVQEILRTSCYDCHSNNTVYPWYANIQPVTWWLQDHVKEGKKELNFNEFLSYAPKKAHHKLEEVVEQLEKDEMPLKSYTVIHRNAIVDAEKEKIISDWAKGLMAEIAATNNLEVKKSEEKH